MRMNSFSQQSIHDWALAAGTAGPWNSSVSLLQRGKLDPKPQFWVAFGTLNQDLANGNLKYVTDLKLRTKLTEAMPFLTERDTPATATDLFSMFIGELQPASIYTAEPRYTEKDVAGICQMCRDGFRMIAEDQMLSPKEAWDKLKPLCNNMSAKQIDKFRSVLSGWEDWTLEEILEMTPPGNGLGYPAQALDRLGNGLVNLELANLKADDKDACPTQP